MPALPVPREPGPLSVAREREAKFEVDDDVALGEWHGTLPGTTVAELAPKELRAEYYDTGDLRLARWGCTMRNRNDEGWMVKVPVPGPGKAVVRDEVRIEADGREPPAAAARLVASLTRGAPLERVATITTNRTATRLQTPTGRVLAEVVDDRVAVDEPGGTTRRFREVEVELAEEVSDDGAARLLDRVTVAGGRLNTTPKLVRGLGRRAAAAPDVVVPEVSGWPTGREVVHAALAKSVAHLVLHLPAVHIGEDPEGVHQARVAIRRLRSDLRTFGVLLDPHWVEQLQPELKWLGGELGRVRDDDVLIESLRDIGAPDSLVEVFTSERHTYRDSFLATLDDPRALRLLDQLVAAAHDPHTAPQADDPADDLLRPTVRKRWRKLSQAVHELGPEPADAALHEVRIRTKRCRYAVEAAAPAFGPDALAWAKQLAGVQDALGLLNDAAVITARLEEMATRIPAQAFAAGQVAGRLAVRAQAGRADWQAAWKKASAKALRTWL